MSEQIVLPWKPYSTYFLAGPSKCGKTQWIQRFIHHKNKMFQDPSPGKVIYFYGVWQHTFEQMERDGIIFVKGLPTMKEVDTYGDGEHTLLVIDDLYLEAAASTLVSNLFTRESHHRKLSVVLVSQNLFHAGRYSRTIQLNTEYLVLFKSPRDANQIQYLARQLYPHHVQAFMSAYQDATSAMHGYLVVDATVNALDDYRLRSRVFPGEDMWIYTYK